MNVRRSVFLLLALWITAACGLKADPRGADQVRPKRISSLTGRMEADGVHLEWQRPSSYANGQRMDDLGGFLVFRGLPGEAAQEIAEIPVADRERFRPEKNFGHVDKESVGKTGTYYYRVISYTTDKYYSEPSNQVTIAIQP